VQTFLPYADFRASCSVLDDRRLGKQRVETFQILRALTWPTYAWKNHPAVTMWRGFVPALISYGLVSCEEWTGRGYADTVADQLRDWRVPPSHELPPWFGLAALHRSHRSSLLRKDPAHYGLHFDDVPDDLPYHWPAPVFPRWPVRRGGRALDLQRALDLLGFAEARPGQAEAVAAVRAGRDAVLSLPPGAGASSTGLLAGLCTPGRTLVVVPPDGPLEAAPRVARPTRSRVPGSVQLPKRAAAASTAKQPTPADRSAMRAEQEPSQWVFRRPGEAAEGPFGLVVLDRTDQVCGWRRPAGTPVLTIVTADRVGITASRRSSS
jgi:hypothetical protein